MFSGFAQEDYQGASNSNVKEKLILSYKLILVPRAKSSVSAAALAGSAQTGKFVAHNLTNLKRLIAMRGK
jgi:hypothetical protein